MEPPSTETNPSMTLFNRMLAHFNSTSCEKEGQKRWEHAARQVCKVADETQGFRNLTGWPNEMVEWILVTIVEERYWFPLLAAVFETLPGQVAKAKAKTCSAKWDLLRCEWLAAIAGSTQFTQFVEQVQTKQEDIASSLAENAVKLEEMSEVIDAHTKAKTVATEEMRPLGKDGEVGAFLLWTSFYQAGSDPSMVPTLIRPLQALIQCLPLNDPRNGQAKANSHAELTEKILHLAARQNKLRGATVERAGDIELQLVKSRVASGMAPFTGYTHDDLLRDATVVYFDNDSVRSGLHAEKIRRVALSLPGGAAPADFGKNSPSAEASTAAGQSRADGGSFSTELKAAFDRHGLGPILRQTGELLSNRSRAPPSDTQVLTAHSASHPPGHPDDSQSVQTWLATVAEPREKQSSEPLLRRSESGSGVTGTRKRTASTHPDASLSVRSKPKGSTAAPSDDMTNSSSKKTRALRRSDRLAASAPDLQS